MLFTLNELKEIFPVWQGPISDDEIKYVSTDSRLDLKDSLFIPIIGDNFDGHDFIAGAIKQEARAALWDKSREVPATIPDDFCLFFVEDTVKALQELAKYYRDKINPVVIGITGSNGKTTTKDILAAIISQKFNTHATKGNFNNHLGLPLTILEMAANTEVLILEMGMSAFKEIEVLTKIARPNYAIITNIGESHIENLGSVEGIAKAKLEIRQGLQSGGTLIIDGDEPLLEQMKSLDNVIACGFGMDNDMAISEFVMESRQTAFTLNKREHFKIGLLGKHHAKNASYAIAVGKALGMTYDEIITGLDNLKHTSMRFELINGKNNVTIINDAYNASASSMKAAITVVKEMTGFKEKVLVLGDILELGAYNEELHRSVASVITEPITAVYTFGSAAKYISDEMKQADSALIYKHFTEKKLLIETLEKYLYKDNVIFFKASRGMAFEGLIEEII